MKKNETCKESGGNVELLVIIRGNVMLVFTNVKTVYKFSFVISLAKINFNSWDKYYGEILRDVLISGDNAVCRWFVFDLFM
ncbi:MAG: hypothetical protein Q4D33_05610 [Prevotellaceae bacterium]|nr:hypothetical protein [Prevotellaceae bacterium]